MIPSSLLPLIVPLIAVALIMLRAKRERPLRPGRLWIAPVFLTPMIGAALYFVPHPAFIAAEYIAMGMAGASGMFFGSWRAHATVLRHDPQTGRIMASQSNLAAAVLAGMLLLRTVAREALGPQTMLVADMSMLFALGMVIALQAALWRRARGLRV